jgi:hypothetical protein
MVAPPFPTAAATEDDAVWRRLALQEIRLCTQSAGRRCAQEREWQIDADQSRPAHQHSAAPRTESLRSQQTVDRTGRRGRRQRRHAAQLPRLEHNVGGEHFERRREHLFAI